MTSSNEIKQWLKSIDKDRFWLAEVTHSSKKTVDGWLSASKSIPMAKQDIIKMLMVDEKNTFEDLYKSSRKEISIAFYGGEWDMIKRCAEKKNCSPERWIEDCVLSSCLALESIENIKSLNDPKYNSPRIYGTRQRPDIA